MSPEVVCRTLKLFAIKGVVNRNSLLRANVVMPPQQHSQIMPKVLCRRTELDAVARGTGSKYSINHLYRSQR